MGTIGLILVLLIQNPAQDFTDVLRNVCKSYISSNQIVGTVFINVNYIKLSPDTVIVEIYQYGRPWETNLPNEVIHLDNGLISIYRNAEAAIINEQQQDELRKKGFLIEKDKQGYIIVKGGDEKKIREPLFNELPTWKVYFNGKGQIMNKEIVTY